jgi:hypothetical protein
MEDVIWIFLLGICAGFSFRAGFRHGWYFAVNVTLQELYKMGIIDEKDLKEYTKK